MNPPRGGAREGAGRKPEGPERLDSLLKVLLMRSDRKRLEKAAESRDVLPSELARSFILSGLRRLEGNAKPKGKR